MERYPITTQDVERLIDNPEFQRDTGLTPNRAAALKLADVAETALNLLAKRAKQRGPDLVVIDDLAAAILNFRKGGEA